jgi:hypothetical protein
MKENDYMICVANGGDIPVICDVDDDVPLHRRMKGRRRRGLIQDLELIPDVLCVLGIDKVPLFIFVLLEPGL